MKSLETIKCFPVLGSRYKNDDYCKISFDEQVLDKNGVDPASSDSCQQYIDRVLTEKNAKIAFGGYFERRSLYRRSSHFTHGEERNVHIGLDLWLHNGAPIYTPLDGVVHSYNNNLGLGDYGPTIIVEHKVEGETIFTLYGHLSLESLKQIEVGQEIKSGELIGWLGDATVNGGYAPHLHFQIIKDLQGKTGDYPGVCSNSEIDYYKSNCPNPEFLLNFG